MAALGVAGYLVLIVSACRAEFETCDRCTLLWRMMVMQSLVGIGFVAWLMLLQWGVIRHFCVYCLSAHLFGVIAFALVLWKAPVWKMGWRPPVVLGSGSGVVLALMIAVHVLVVPDLIVVQAAEEFGGVRAAGETEIYEGHGVRLGKQKESRTLPFLNGNLSLDLYKVPLAGHPEAEHAVVELTDYCCPECRKVHERLHDFREKYGIALAVVILPVPMNPECNPAVTQTHPAFKDSCTLARYAMAVAAADRKTFETYHEFLMQGGRPPSVEEARRRAEEMVGKEAFAEALQQPSVKQWMEDAMNVYRFIEGRSLPKLIVGDNVLSAGSGSKLAFFEKFASLLGVEKPAESR